LCSFTTWDRAPWHPPRLVSSGGSSATAVQAQKLIAEVRAAQDSHPLVEAGTYTGPAALLAALEAVSRGLGTIGGKLTWSRVPPGGGQVPMTMWLDTAETIDERGTLFVPG
jgi:hypothetical protein